jgi:hypothetical protein
MSGGPNAITNRGTNCFSNDGTNSSTYRRANCIPDQRTHSTHTDADSPD